jgi:hypothetical protein
MMNWEQLLSLKRQATKANDCSVEQDDTRLGFEVDYDRIIFLRRLEVYKINTSYSIIQNRFCAYQINV